MASLRGTAQEHSISKPRKAANSDRKVILRHENNTWRGFSNLAIKNIRGMIAVSQHSIWTTHASRLSDGATTPLGDVYRLHKQALAFDDCTFGNTNLLHS